MNITLAGRMVLVEYHTNEGLTPGGLYVSEPDFLPPYRAEVLDIGPGVTECKPGDDVIFQHHAGDPIKDEGRTLYLLNEDDIHAVLVYKES